VRLLLFGGEGGRGDGCCCEREEEVQLPGLHILLTGACVPVGDGPIGFYGRRVEGSKLKSMTG